MAGKQIELNRQLYNALDVTPTIKFWTVLVQVVEKHRVREAQGDKNLKFQNYVLTDMQGTKVAGVAFRNHVSHISKVLKPFQRYYISNAQVKPTKPGYELGPCKYDWVLSNRTLIESVDEDVPHKLEFPFAYTKFSDFTKFVDKDICINIKALVVHSYAVYNASKPMTRDYIIIDETKKAMILRLWEDFLDNEDIQVSTKLPEPSFILARNLKVTTHHGISLTTKNNPYFLVDPPLERTDPLLEWYKNHSDEIEKLIEAKSYMDPDKLLPLPQDSEIVSLHEVLTNIDLLKTAWVSASLQLMPAQNALWYTVCSSCQKSLNARIDWKVTCTGCGERTTVEPRCRMDVYLTDSTATICATIFGLQAEKLTHLTAEELRAADEKGTPLMSEIEKLIYKKEAICFLKYFERTFGGKTEKNYPVLQLYTQEELKNVATVQENATKQLESNTTLSAFDMESPKNDEEFFSPSAKKIIEEIGASSATVDSSSNPSITSKRALKFGKIDMQVSDTPMQQTLVEAPTPTAITSSAESPVKKLKNKEKQS